MPRRPRDFYPGAPTHLTACGVDDQPIFRSDLDRHDLLSLLRKATEQVGWQVLCWCLMTTHYHLLVLPPARAEQRISWAIQKVNSVYARDFNRRYRRRGHLFGSRFGDTLIESDVHGHRTVAYILDNPVRAGIVKRYEEWPWSGLETLRPRDELGTLLARSRAVHVRRAG